MNNSSMHLFIFARKEFGGESLMEDSQRSCLLSASILRPPYEKEYYTSEISMTDTSSIHYREVSEIAGLVVSII